MKCRAALAVEKGIVKLTQVDVKAPKADEIQMKVVRTLISPGTERAFILNMDNAHNEFPFVPGYCCAGYVNETGAGVTEFKKGDKIAAFALDIGHREVGNVVQKKVVKLPDDFPMDHAAFVALGQVSLQAVRKCAIEIGEGVAVMGLGIIGLLALRFASINGALPLIGIDRDNERLERAKKYGADFVLNNREGDFSEKLHEITGGKGPAVVIEGTGFPAAINQALEMIARMGRLSLLGSTRGVSEVNFYRDVHKKGVSVLGAHAEIIPQSGMSYPRHWTFKDDAECFIRLIQSGKLDVEPMIDWRINPSQIEEAYERLLSWDKGLLGIIINWEN
ncbi:MAG: zinc-binding alcohol dehydrogenase [Clostridiales bacterium]|jgi:2-desacetyl-2-hydroxyethyl bacteriochlorophyllide A dehydrogenase|nr:zinc-binding alcohol dehydrogenase [Clostridiales bacterium]